MSLPKLIIFEGVDAAGKTSICQRFVASSQSRGQLVQLASFPGKTPGTIGSLVYRLHHDPLTIGVDKITPTSLQALHIAAHLDAIETELVPALEAGKSVVLDRYWWSTWTYGIIGGVLPQILDALIEAERLAWGRWRPDAVFVLTRESPLRNEPLEMWHRIKTAYETLQERENGKYPIYHLPNDGNVEDTVAQAISFSHDFWK